MHFIIFLLVTSIQTWNIAGNYYSDCTYENTYNLPDEYTASGILAFGDSMLDTGNNLYIPLTPLKSNFWPYGIDFTVTYPSGRFSNGKMLPDLLARYLGACALSDIILPYLSPNIQPLNLLDGLSFASAGAGYDILTSTLKSSISLEDQIKNLKDFNVKLSKTYGNLSKESFYIKAMAFVSAGTEDIINYFPSSSRSVQYDINAYTDLLAQTSFNFVKNLIDQGVRRIGVFGVPPIGCFPLYRSPGLCDETLNKAALLLNSKLSHKLADLGAESQLNSTQIVFMNIYEDYMRLIQNGTKYGFDIVTKACCGIGNSDTKYLCNKINPSLGDMKGLSYLFYDGHHLTEKGYSILALFNFAKYMDKFTKPY
ncbi:GDSL esterase/lipase At3g14820-like [Mercurialis annua]|uniref:GDSL esterase/lipase At3g14820-like n=1 Tax=Mercurialis annua TaxID=3986 RepID=UPI00215F513A|nr:GDSL esterase/lipase At3g14820-like [Mercurialis annua]